MNTATVPTFNASMTEISQDLIAAIAEHPGDSPARRVFRQQVVADTMMSLEPQTPMETILAGHCLVFDHLILESAHQLLNCQEERIRLRIRPQVCASARMFLAELATFERWHARSMDRLTAEQKIETRVVQPAQRAAVQSPARPATEVGVPTASAPSATAIREPAGAAAAQIRPDSPLAAERERAMVLAKRGQTAATVDEELHTLIHGAGLTRAEQPRSDALAAGQGAKGATEAGSTARETRVEELT
jgi:hypothetical protein